MTPKYHRDELGQPNAPVGRVCTKCLEFKEFQFFYKGRRGLHGFRSICIDCELNRARSPSLLAKERDRLRQIAYAEARRNGMPARKQEVRALTSEMLRDILTYDAATGVFTWALVRRRGVVRGAMAGTITRKGYVSIRLLGKNYLAHRLAWLYTHGKWPDEQIDHINGVKADNRLVNLRDVTAATNRQNERRARKNNKLGLMGVCQTPDGYAAGIKVNGVHVHIGMFRSAEAAHEAYLEEKRKHHAGFMC